MRDQDGNRYWNAFPECCDFYGAGTDDAGYLAALMAEAKAKLSVDGDRIYFIGHSNGGFMVNRMGCQFSRQIAGIITISGSMSKINTYSFYKGQITEIYQYVVPASYKGSITEWRHRYGRHWPAFNLQFPTKVFAWLKDKTRLYQ
ncbi:hypothetical protein FGO68_gene8980 [Halteria grandinella]|uniref:BAAT/Acyl-CoA thioester hydrolase C-terminal domain-containing protein n=1 Tax=Halteria grandinella TaxID=5974 RepID=A0A8J8NLQ1_HALGN|nr:hypothetical protein FGO68_gene8980 [Halteria grandinella]